MTLPPGMISWFEGRIEKRGGTRRTGKGGESGLRGRGDGNLGVRWGRRKVGKDVRRRKVEKKKEGWRERGFREKERGRVRKKAR